MKKASIVSICIFALVAFFVWAPDAQAYQFYSDATNNVGGCAQCHTGFRDNTSYVSEAEGFAWGNSLHNVHLNNTDIESSCENCHGGVGTAGRTVNLSSSANAKDGVNAIACMGCHGRLEDANAVGPGPGWGAGLRQHHTNAGVPADSDGLLCVDCHADADPAAFTPASEDTMPPWYASTTNDIVGLTMAPCNANLEEELSGDPANLGLDNDGDLAYDTNDPDCEQLETNCFDGVDNDADGLIDCEDPDCEGAVDGLCNTGQPGICADGTFMCMGGALVCMPNNQPQPEGPPGDPTCSDGLDNDCDGLTDMMDPDCMPLPPETNCFDGIDNDNDDLIDCLDPDCEGAVDGACNTGLPGICADGILVCMGGAAVCMQNNQPQPELCNDLDDDCDGLIDEDFPNKGMPCTVGIGACQRTGTYICTVDGSGTICDAVPGQPMPEGPPGDPTCSDGLDNDCDGSTDMMDPDCMPLPPETNCFDGIDNDNDDLIDCMDPDCEGAVDGACITGLPGICADGTLTCVGGMAMCVQNTQSMPEGNQYTNCEDGLDNDCDGLTDYDDPGCVMMEADVWLERLRVPKSLKLATGASRDKRIVAVGEGDTKPQDATVSLTVSPMNGVTVSLVPASITTLVEPGNGKTQFKFMATVTCNQTGEWALMWTASISALENRDTTNDTLTGTTNVTCR